MKVLHTSDWHLGHKLYGRHRYQEFADFLNWLYEIIDKNGIEILLIAGDIFNTQTPSNKILKLYYNFLSKISSSSCRHVIIIGGNHDSPALLNGPCELLSFLNIHVIGRVPENIEDEIILLRDKNKQPQLMVLAVPYLRDQDIRSTQAGETLEEKETNLLQGIQRHYNKVYELAMQKMAELQSPVPMIATGHLFCQGGSTIQGDGLRELYVGTLAHVDVNIFPAEINYIALGHLHQMQKVNKQENRRYSGSPLVMNFQEAHKQKYVLVVNLSPDLHVEQIEVPHFQLLDRISGDIKEILDTIERLKAQNQSIFLEIHYNGQSLVDDLQEQINFAIKDSKLEVLRINNKQIYNHVLQQTTTIKTLEDLSPLQVFQQCLDLHEINKEQQQEMLTNFTAVMAAIHEEERDAS